MQTKTNIKNRINTVGRNAVTQQERVQSILVDVTAHALKSGDVTGFSHLLANMTGMAKKDAVTWINTYGFAGVKADMSIRSNKKARLQFIKDSAIADLNSIPEAAADVAVAALADNLWHLPEGKEPKGPTDYDVAATLARIAKTITDAHKKERKVKIDDDAITKALTDMRHAITLLEAAAKPDDVVDTRMAEAPHVPVIPQPAPTIHMVAAE